jgi:hypothetical protein
MAWRVSFAGRECIRRVLGEPVSPGAHSECAARCRHDARALRVGEGSSSDHVALDSQLIEDPASLRKRAHRPGALGLRARELGQRQLRPPDLESSGCRRVHVERLRVPPAGLVVGAFGGDPAQCPPSRRCPRDTGPPRESRVRASRTVGGRGPRARPGGSGRVRCKAATKNALPRCRTGTGHYRVAEHLPAAALASSAASRTAPCALASIDLARLSGLVA